MKKPKISAILSAKNLIPDEKVYTRGTTAKDKREGRKDAQGKLPRPLAVKPEGRKNNFTQKL